MQQVNNIRSVWIKSRDLEADGSDSEKIWLYLYFGEMPTVHFLVGERACHLHYANATLSARITEQLFDLFWTQIMPRPKQKMNLEN